MSEPVIAAPDAFETARLLARLKLQTRRLFDEPVDLVRLQSDTAYAASRLAELEEMASDEEFLVLVLRLRAVLLPLPKAAPAAAASVNAVETESAAAVAPAVIEAAGQAKSGMRHYRFGARGG